jgi:hypothetical protein
VNRLSDLPEGGRDRVHGSDRPGSGQGDHGRSGAGVEHARANGAKKTGARSYLGYKLTHSRERLSKVHEWIVRQTIGIAEITKGYWSDQADRVFDQGAAAAAEAALQTAKGKLNCARVYRLRNGTTFR